MNKFDAVLRVSYALTFLIANACIEPSLCSICFFISCNFQCTMQIDSSTASLDLLTCDLTNKDEAISINKVIYPQGLRCVHSLYNHALLQLKYQQGDSHGHSFDYCCANNVVIDLPSLSLEVSPLHKSFSLDKSSFFHF